MNRYNNGKVYKLVNTVDDKIYVGSTCLSLAKRKSGHKNDAKTRNSHVYSHLNSIGWDNVRIVLIESVTAETKDQLLMREQYYMDLLKPSLNRQSAIDDCPHNREKNQCKDCHGSGICIHNRNKSQCKECHGSGICIHNRQRHQCKNCQGSSICPHQRVKSSCKDCHGSSICIHNRRKQHCLDCQGSSICQHNRQKAQCLHCGSRSICIHNRRKSSCKDCNGEKYYCYECDESFNSKQSLEVHEKSERHKEIYNAMFEECFN